MKDYDSYQEGIIARKAGRPITDCPYKFDTQSARKWCAGWCDEDMLLMDREIEDGD